MEAAFAAVPRERFAPEAPPEAAYRAQDVVVTKRGPDGRAMSSISAPWLQAEMLEAAQLTTGAKVLEVGSGGYNAALIAEIVGPCGLVVSVDIDPFVVERRGPHLDIEGVPGPDTSPGSTRPIRPDERPGVSGFTAQKSSATSSVLVAPRHPRKDRRP
ncbi:class I SAM-dependent methyltransferase [Streptosporangium sandarakinum]|uniref:hypothetical protein n=1 Tax=Streptosporangium sandarakinum TaxID=1260955 RepID=UPI00370F7ABF